MVHISLQHKTVLVTGAAGFIGSHLCRRLLDACADLRIVGIDNLNSYYDISLKEERLSTLSAYGSRFEFVKGDIADAACVHALFEQHRCALVVNLAAQAGVRYSIENPAAYIQANIVGFFNILEACRHHPVEHLVFASSSSVYGSNKTVPYSTDDKVDNPVSLYAATKKSDELLAHAYAKLYGIPATGLRFFTVYGPQGRPDMAYFKFAEMLTRGETIPIYNNGDMYRDFTYIDDIVTGIAAVMQHSPTPTADGAPYKIYNIGNSAPESLLTFVETLERCLIAEGLISEAGKKKFLPMQPGDVYQTYADVGELERDFGFRPQTPLADGLAKFAAWYKGYHAHKEVAR